MQPRTYVYSHNLKSWWKGVGKNEVEKLAASLGCI